MTSYLDVLPRNAAESGGAGISNYLNSIPASNVAGGPGLTSYTDSIGGGSVASDQSFSPFSTTSASPATTASTTGSYSFTLDANAEVIEQLAGAGGRRVTLKGTINHIA